MAESIYYGPGDRRTLITGDDEETETTTPEREAEAQTDKNARSRSDIYGDDDLRALAQPAGKVQPA